MVNVGVIHVTIPGTNGINTLINNFIKYGRSSFKYYIVEWEGDKSAFKKTLNQTLEESISKGRLTVIHLHISHGDALDTVLEVASGYPSRFGTPIVYTAHSIAREELAALYNMKREDLNKIKYFDKQKASWTYGQDILFSDNQLVRWLVRWFAFPSIAVFKQLLRNYLPIRDMDTIYNIVNRSVIIPNGSDIYIYDRPEIRGIAKEIREILKSDFIIIAPYRLETSKGLDLLLEGFRMAIENGKIPKNSILLLVGPFRESELKNKYVHMLNRLDEEGIRIYPNPNDISSLNILANIKSAQELKKKFEELSGVKHANILYLGKTSNREVLATLYMIADVTVMPTRSESFGYPVLESLMLGTPAAVSNLGGPKEEFITTKYYAIPIGKEYDIKPEDVEKVLEFVYKNRNILKEKLRMRKDEIISRYDARTMVRSYENLYLSIFIN